MRAKLIRGYDGYYKVREDGTVWSCRKKGANGKSRGARGPWWKMKSGAGSGGHLFVYLWKNGVSKQHLIHRLVLEAFVGPCPPRMRCRHYPDQDPTNNQLENLAWASNSVNMQDKKENGTNNDGEKNGSAKLTEVAVKKIRSKYATGDYSQKELGRMFGVRQTTISLVVRGDTWK